MLKLYTVLKMETNDKNSVDRESLPAPSEVGLKLLLESSFIKGIGRTYASRIIEKTGDRILKSGFDFEKELGGIEGLGQSKIQELEESWSNLPYSPVLLAFLYSCGLNDSEVDKILSHYKKHTEKVIKEDPYQMVEEVFKLSFFTADKIGQRLGYAAEDPRRLRGALLTAVHLWAEDGNMFATEEETVATAARISKTSPEQIIPQIESLVKEERLIRSHGGLYLPVYYKAEKDGAEKIAALIKEGKKEENIFDYPVMDREGNMLTEAQLEAIRTVMDNPVTIITGGPGTGKTTAVRGIISLLENLDKKVTLAAPTGRAAKRLTDLAGREAKTIHRLLGYIQGRGYRNKHFDTDILIIDEASMLEQVLFNHLLQALKQGTKVVLVGDPDQLPAIGAGDVLKDMIKSGRIPVVTLHENFRHKEGSGIAVGAAAIKDGKQPEIEGVNDFMIFTEDGSKRIHDRLIQLVREEVPTKYNIKPRDIQIVTPQREGPLGSKALNPEIQEIVNGGAPGIRHGVKVFRLGDRVMQTTNSSERNTYNGETGWVSQIDPEEQWIEVTFYDGKHSKYSKRDFKELTLAYATTVHKLQGSETDYIVMPVTLSHRQMLYRNLLYTGVSRAKKLCVLVGEEKAIKTAIENPSPSVRHSNFKKRLRENLPQKA